MGGASWQLSSWPFSKRPRVSEAEAPADDGDVVSELSNHPEAFEHRRSAPRLLLHRTSNQNPVAAIGVNQPCLTLLAATDRDLLSLLDAHLVRVTDSPPSRGKGDSPARP
jgi:hypothetical protein